MLCTFLRTIRGWFTDIRSLLGPVGIRIRESGLTVRFCRGEDPGSESASSADLAGAGAVGDSTGITTTRFTTTTDISRTALSSTTAMLTTEVAWRAEQSLHAPAR